MEKLLPWEHPIFFSLWQALASEFWSRVLRLKEIDFISRPLVLLDYCYNLLFYCRLVCCRKQFSIKGQTHIARTAAIGVQQRQLPMSLIIHSGCRTLFFSVSTEICNRRREKGERDPLRLTTLDCVCAPQILLWDSGGTFPTKHKKYGTAKQLNARRTRPTGNSGWGCLSIKRHFQPSFGCCWIRDAAPRRNKPHAPSHSIIASRMSPTEDYWSRLKYIGRGAEVTATLISLKIYTQRLSICMCFFFSLSPLTVKLRKFAALRQKL